VAFLNPDFLVGIVMKVPNTIQVSVSGYFLAKKKFSYFEVKKYF